MIIQVNGESKSIEEDLNSPFTLEKIVAYLGYNTRLVVVEYNGVIRPPQTWQKQEVKDGDVIEIVTIVGGGS